MFIKMFKELKAQREREKAYEGIKKMKELIDEMEASGKYPKEKIDNLHLWFVHACVEYGRMF